MVNINSKNNTTVTQPESKTKDYNGLLTPSKKIYMKTTMTNTVIELLIRRENNQVSEFRRFQIIIWVIKPTITIIETFWEVRSNIVINNIIKTARKNNLIITNILPAAIFPIILARTSLQIVMNNVNSTTRIMLRTHQKIFIMVSNQFKIMHLEPFEFNRKN